MAVRLIADASAPARDALESAAALLSRGGVVAYPTDTLYGLAVDPRSAAAVERLFAIKRRRAEVAIPLIAASLAQVRQAVTSVPPVADRLASRFWPGPLTLILPAHPVVSEAVHGGRGTVAIRVPDHPVARGLAEAFGFPVTATSANRAAAPAASTADEALEALGEELDVVIDAGPTPGGLPSTIVDVTGAAPALVRAGVVPWDRVLESIE
jgi:L-threonylcarbamoyladenylate synthase